MAQASEIALLNPTLYHGLQRLLEERGDASLEVQNAGIAAQTIVVQDPRHRANQPGNGKRVQIVNQGEEYRMNCPFCGDTRGRFYVNHLWGVFDKRVGRRNVWLAHCWNEECQDDWDNMSWLLERVYGNNTGRSIKIRAGIRKLDDGNIPVQKPPGEVYTLEHLLKHEPNHPAISYILSRNFDPRTLSKVYGVGYCANSVYTLARNRIYFPYFMDDQLLGWQCRTMGEWKKGDPPKYFSCPGQRRRYIGYNYNRALAYKTIALVEGPLDVCGAGPWSIGLLGKTMSNYLRLRLARDASEQSFVAILLDPTQSEEEIAKKRKHHIEKLFEQLQPLLPGRVFTTYLPDGVDPGSFDRDLQKDCMRDAARNFGIKTISFKKL